MASELDETTQVVERDSLKRPAHAGGAGVLIVVEGGPIGQRFPLKGESLRIGRGYECEIVINERDVSREHAIVRSSVADGSATLVDLNSTNGTYVNESRIARATELRDGDRLRIGEWTFKFLCADSPELAFHAMMQERSSTDPLTGCLNRRGLWQAYDAALRESIALKQPLSLLFLDLDHFKELNDSWGHLCGDAVLRELVSRLTAMLRGNERLGRYGGEEFLMLLPGLEMLPAAARAEAARHAIGSRAFSWDGIELPVTVSIGVSTSTEIGGSMRTLEVGDLQQQLVDIADRKLYKAKRAGRNRVAA